MTANDPTAGAGGDPAATTVAATFDYHLGDPATAHRAIAEVAEELGRARALAQEGGMVDLSGLDASVAVICEAALGFAPESGRFLLPPLLDLARDLEDLSGEIRRQHALIRGRMEADEAARRTRAAAVYGRPAGQPPKS